MDQNNYGFIMNQAPEKPKGLAGLSPKKRMMLGIGFGIIVLLVIFIIVGAINGNKKSTAEIIIPVAAAQADIITITDVGSKEARDSAVVNTTATVNLVVSSHAAQSSKRLGKDAAKLIAPYRNNGFEKPLDEAIQEGSFDKNYEAILSAKLDEYRQLLVTAYNQTTSASLKKELADQHSQIGILLGEPTTPVEAKM